MSPPSASRKEPAVFDASPLIFLDILGYVSSLRELHRVVLPEAVRRELLARPASPGSVVPALPWVERRTPTAESVRRVKTEPPTLGEGETEAIALALELSSLVVLDDKRARSRARRAGLRITGTLGILLRLHRLRLTSRDLGSDLARLQEAGMRLSPAVRRAFLNCKKPTVEAPASPIRPTSSRPRAVPAGEPSSTGISSPGYRSKERPRLDLKLYAFPHEPCSLVLLRALELPVEEDPTILPLLDARGGYPEGNRLLRPRRSDSAGDPFANPLALKLVKFFC